VTVAAARRSTRRRKGTTDAPDPRDAGPAPLAPPVPEFVVPLLEVARRVRLRAEEIAREEHYEGGETR
jgi:hypothetical protein